MKQLRLEGQKKLQAFLKFCLDEGWTKEQIDILREMWLNMRDEYGNILLKKIDERIGGKK